MEVWNFLNLILKFICYLLVFGVVGTKLFLLHFRQHLPQTTIDYCEELFRKSARFGIFASVLMFFAMVGNFGGNLSSVFDSVMVELVLGEKAGEAMVLLLAGFFLCLMKSARHLFVINLVHLVGNFSILLSFAWVGHASKIWFNHPIIGRCSLCLPFLLARRFFTIATDV